MRVDNILKNLKTFCPYVVGENEIPLLNPTKTDCPNFVGFNYAKTYHDRKGEVGIHFFVEDYQFERVWQRPAYYAQLLKDYRCVSSPDFSLFTDYPKPIQVYNHYRKHWIGAYWQHLGLDVLPTICWTADKSCFEWCFDGEPKNSDVIISSVGTQMSKGKQNAFLEGYFRMVDVLTPNKIYFVGKIPKEIQNRDNVVQMSVFTDRFDKLRKANGE